MKKLLSTIPLLLLLLAMIFTLAACTAPAVVTEDGGDTIAGAAIKTGLKIVEAAALALISVFGAWWASKAKDNKKLQNLNIAVEGVIKMATLTVGELNQTVVKSMKKMSENGKLSKEQIEILKKELLDKTMEKLTDPTVDLLNAAGADICAIITGAAEDWIYTLDNDVPIVGVPVGSE